jgi:hypothetical protein
VDPFSEESIADGIVTALAETDRYAALGRQRAAAMTWGAAAALTASAYDEALLA